MNVGGYPAAPGRQPGLRAAVNARLEEISFRTGLISAVIALAALVAIGAAGFYAATSGHGSTAVVVSADNAPKTSPKAPAPATATPPASTVASPSATAKPTTQQAAPAGVSPQSAVASQSQSQVPATDAATDGSPGYGRPGPHGYGQRFGGYGFPHGGSGFRGSGGFSGFGRGGGRGY